VKKLLVVALLALVLVTGCGWFQSQPDIVRLDIVGAAGLVIAPSGTASAAVARAEGENRLFKVTEDGYLLEVTYTDESGDSSVLTMSPSDVYNVDSTYVVVIFNQLTGYLVQKTDGAVFSLDEIGIPQRTMWGYINQQVVQTDASGNLYYNSDGPAADASTGKIYRIDVTNPAELTAALYSPDSDEVASFQIDRDGNMIYYANWVAGSADYRIKKSNGGLYPIPPVEVFWVGPAGIIYYSVWENDTDTKVVQASVDSAFDVSETQYGNTVNGRIASQDAFCYKLDLEDRVIIVDKDSNVLTEVHNPTDSVRFISGIDMATIEYAVSSPGYYYLSGTNASSLPVLLKVDPTDDTVTELLPAGAYDIYSMYVDSSDKVTFNALRMADGKKVFGQIDAAGTLTITDDQLDVEAVVLERIN